MTDTKDAAVGALEANLWSMWAQFGRAPGCALVDEPRLLRFETPLRFAPYNSVMRTHLDELVDDTIDAVLAAYATRDVPVVWVVHPTARPADLAARLEARGLVESEVVPGMVADLGSLPPSDPTPDGVSIDEIGPNGFDPYLDLLTWRYSLPEAARTVLGSIMHSARFGAPGSSNRAWVARRDGEVLSKVTLHLDGRTAGIYGVATHTSARGLGLARTLTLHALHTARNAGVDVGVLHSTPMAVSLYEAMGFARVADFALYSQPDALHL